MKENSESRHREKTKGSDKRGKESRNNEMKIKLKQEKKENGQIWAETYKRK